MIDKFGHDWGKQKVTLLGKVLFVVDIENQQHKEAINKLKELWNTT